MMRLNTEIIGQKGIKLYMKHLFEYMKQDQIITSGELKQTDLMTDS